MISHIAFMDRKTLLKKKKKSVPLNELQIQSSPVKILACFFTKYDKAILNFN